MSGDVQPRKRKEKRRKKDDLGVEEPRGTAAIFGEGDVLMHSHHEHGTGGHWCAKIIFFSLLAVLVTLIGLIILENRGLSELEANAVESRYSGVLEGWIEDAPDDDHHDEHTLELKHQRFEDNQEDADDDESGESEHDDNQEDNIQEDDDNKEHENDEELQDSEEHEDDDDDEHDNNEEDDDENNSDEEYEDDDNVDEHEDKYTTENILVIDVQDDEDASDEQNLEEDNEDDETMDYNKYYKYNEHRHNEIENYENLKSNYLQEEENDEGYDENESNEINYEENIKSDYKENSEQNEEDEDDFEEEIERIEKESVDEVEDAISDIEETQEIENEEEENTLDSDEVIEPPIVEQITAPSKPLIELEDEPSTEKPADTLAEEEEYEKRQEQIRLEKQESSSQMWLKLTVGGALLVATHAVIRRFTAPRDASEAEDNTTHEDDPSLIDRRMTLIPKESAPVLPQENFEPIQVEPVETLEKYLKTIQSDTIYKQAEDQVDKHEEQARRQDVTSTSKDVLNQELYSDDDEEDDVERDVEQYSKDIETKVEKDADESETEEVPDDVEIIDDEQIDEEIEEEEDEDEEEISDVDDAELLSRLEAKYGRLPEPERPGQKHKDGGNQLEDEWPGEPSEQYWRQQLELAEQEIGQD